MTGSNFNKPNDLAFRDDFETGVGVQNKALVYNSIRHLYYSNYLNNGFLGSGSIFTTRPPDITNNSTLPYGPYENNIQSSLPQQRVFPIVVGEDQIRVYSIPVRTKNGFGESIVPGSVRSESIILDSSKDGNLVFGGKNIGNVFYDSGIIVMASSSNNVKHAHSDLNTMSFSSSHTAYVTEYICTAGPNEFNYSLNPTLTSGSTSTKYNEALVNSPEFMPYVTTVGLYNENQELIMVGKLGQPVQLNPYTDTNFTIRLDR
jgi:hypothetical protein